MYKETITMVTGTEETLKGLVAVSTYIFENHDDLVNTGVEEVRQH